MKKEIIINSALNEVRIAITEDKRLAELFIEMPDKERSIGNMYLGKVSKIIQGINAAFINIGTNHDAFLHFPDIDDSLENSDKDSEFDEDEDFLEEFTKPEKLQKKKIEDSEKISDLANTALRKTKFQKTDESPANQPSFMTKRSGEVKINLEPKQNVIVQVAREAYGNKGVRVTTKIGIPGRYVVLLPFDNMIGVSKKIGTLQERKRLRFLARTTLPEGFGCIIRTAANGKNENELRKDWESLLKVWQEIELKVKKATGPMLLYQDMPLATSVVRDLFSNQVTKVTIDSKKLYKEISGYIKWASPSLLNKVQLFESDKPIFDAFGIEKELSLTYKRKVPLQSGGSIIVDQTEAMTVIDVNSGRAISEDHQEQTALKTNIEAAKEIARQIRLRDLSGIILIDFIDMSQDRNKKRLYMQMRKELNRDRAKTVAYPLTQLSLMQITRQRVNQNISEKTSETCPTCQGSGRIASKSVLVNAIERWLKNFRAGSREFRLILYVHPHVAAFLTEGTLSRISRLMIKYFVKIKIQQSDLIHIDQYKFFSVRKQKDITQEYN